MGNRVLTGQPAPGSLTNIQQVLALGVDGARTNRLPVAIEGVVTLPVPGGNWLYVQDQTAGGLVIHSNSLPERFAGQKVRVTGIVGAGLFSPFIGWANVEVIGTNALPEPLHLPITRYAQGDAFGQWAEIEATVRDVALEGNRLNLRAVQQGRTLNIQATPAGGKLPLSAWPDTVARFRGVVWTEVDSRNKPIGFTFYVPGSDFIDVLSSPGTNIWAQAAAPLNSRKRREAGDARLKVAGTFLHETSDHCLAIRTEQGAVLATLLDPIPPMDGRRIIPRANAPRLKPGDQVEVLGAVTNAVGAPKLIESEVRVTSSGPEPIPLTLSVEELATGRYEADLVTVEGNTFRRSDDTESFRGYGAIELDRRHVHFDAVVPRLGGRTNAFGSVPSNSHVRVTGICRMKPAEYLGAHPISIELRRASDLEVLGPVSFWDAVQPQQVLAMFGGTGIIALAWIWTLRRQIQKRTRQLTVSEGRYRTLVEQGPTPLIVLDAFAGRIDEANEAAAQFLSRDRKALLRATIAELADHVDSNRTSAVELEQELNRLATQGKEGTLEWARALRDGTTQICEIRVAPLDGGARSVTAWRDITAQKQTEEKALRSETTTRIINYFATSLLKQDTEEDILWDLAKNCVSQLGFVDCVIYLFDPKRANLIQKAAYGPKSPVGRDIKNPIIIPAGTGIVGSVGRSGKAEVISDTRLDGRYIIDDELRLSEIAVPIVANNETLGVIDSEHPRKNFFTQHHLEVLTSIASLCANKIVRVRAELELQMLNQELERRISERTNELIQANQKLRQEIAERSHAEKVQKALYQISEAIHTTKDLPSLYSRIHSIIGQLMSAKNFYIALQDAAGLVSFPYHVDEADAPPPPRRGRKGMTEYVLRTGRPALVNLRDIEGLKQSGEYIQSGCPAKIWLGVPLSISGRTFGVMAVQDHTNEHAFAESERRILSFVADQTALAIERKHTEEALRQSAAQLRSSEEQFSKAFRSSPSLMALTRMDDGRFIDMNEAFLRALNRTADEVIGKTTLELDLWESPEERDSFLRDLRTQGAVRDRERRYLINGQPRVFLHSAEMIMLQETRCLLTVAVDITDRKKVEAELLKSLDRERELSQLKSNFVSTVSHEFRTPLEIIMSSGEILERYFERLRPEQRQEHLQSIHSAVRRMSMLMEEVLLLGRVEAGKVQCDQSPLDVPVFCKRLIEEIRAATDDRCPIELDTENLPAQLAQGDENLLRHILTNLLSNAVKYSRPGGTVNLVVTRQEGFAIFQVMDTGCGIPAADQERIFQAFQRGQNVAKIPGTGLGLVITKRCVELHDGRIRFRSEEGKGTTFEVRLPIYPSDEIDHHRGGGDSTWFYRKPAVDSRSA